MNVEWCAPNGISLVVERSAGGREPQAAESRRRDPIRHYVLLIEERSPQFAIDVLDDEDTGPLALGRIVLGEFTEVFEASLRHAVRRNAK